MKTVDEMITSSNFADDEFLTRTEICELLKISKPTLRGWERQNAGPPKVKIGGTVRYPRKFLNKYLADRVQVSTVEEQ